MASGPEGTLKQEGRPGSDHHLGVCGLHCQLDATGGHKKLHEDQGEGRWSCRKAFMPVAPTVSGPNPSTVTSPSGPELW